jgi:hypothetical protein
MGLTHLSGLRDTAVLCSDAGRELAPKHAWLYARAPEKGERTALSELPTIPLNRSEWIHQSLRPFVVPHRLRYAGGPHSDRADILPARVAWPRHNATRRELIRQVFVP